jgi:hypothetical protein
MSSTSVGNVVAIHKLEIGFVDLDIHEDDQLAEAQFPGEWRQHCGEPPRRRSVPRNTQLRTMFVAI